MHGFQLQLGVLFYVCSQWPGNKHVNLALDLMILPLIMMVTHVTCGMPDSGPSHHSAAVLAQWSLAQMQHSCRARPKCPRTYCATLSLLLDWR